MKKNLPRKPQNIFLSTGLAPYARLYNLEPADCIKNPIFQTGLSQHHSIYLGVDDFGHEWISENHHQQGVRMITAEDFFREGKKYTFEKFEGSYTDRVNAVKRALHHLGKPYHLINYNCEHYASYVQSGKAVSRQVENVFFLAGAALLIGVLSSE